MNFTKPLKRILPAVAITAGLLGASPSALAADKKAKTITATIALGDKRPVTVHAKAKPKAKVKAKIAQAPCTNTNVTPTADNLEVIRAAILCLHNEIRSDKGLALLKDNAKLRKAALSHSATMVSQGFFEHTSPDGRTFVDRIIGARYAKRNDGWSLGENLAWGTGDLGTPAALMDAWMHSAGHKANIVNKAYREVGIGVRLGVPSDEGVGATVTADFGVKL